QVCSRAALARVWRGHERGLKPRDYSADFRARVLYIPRIFGGEENMRKSVLIALFVLFATSAPAFSQSSNASLSGTVSDAGKALIPGVAIMAKNTETGVVSTAVSNESGTYNVSGLLPGTYTVSAELPGFRTQTFTDVRLGNAAQARLNFTLQVAGLNQSVEVT